MGPTANRDDIIITNDGATILKNIHLENPSSKILIDICKVQDAEQGDGTTSVVVLACELLKEAQQLIQKKIHPMIIIEGFREALEHSRKTLEHISFTHGGNPTVFRKDLINIARTSLSSKIVSQYKDRFSHLAVDAIMRLRGSNELEMIHIISKLGATMKESFLDDGFILNKKLGLCQPRRLNNARIMIANTSMDSYKIKIYGTKVKADNVLSVAEIELAEKLKMEAKCNKIISHGINCFINRQLIYDYPEQIFTQNGVITIEHADFEGIERLAKVVGGDIVSTFDNPKSVKLGFCKLLDEIMIGEDKVIHFSGVEVGEASTIVLRGASDQVLEEAKRSIHDALCVILSTVKDSRVIYGGGFSEMQMAKAVEAEAARIPGKKSLAMMSSAKALREIPSLVCTNAGMESTEVISTLRAEHMKQSCRSGIDVLSGNIRDMKTAGILEPFKVKLHILLSATEAAECILRVDDVIVNKRKEKKKKKSPLFFFPQKKKKKKKKKK